MSETSAGQKKNKWYRYRVVVPLLLVLIAAVTVIETWVLDLGLDLPVSNSVLVFSLININSLLVLLLLFLVVRNLVKLVFENRAKVIGAKLRTKLVLAFITLSLVPSGVLFFLNLQFIGTSLEYWFDIHLDRPLQDSIHVGRLYYRNSTQEALNLAQRLAGEASQRGIAGKAGSGRLNDFLARKREEHHLLALKIMDRDLNPVGEALDQDNRAGAGMDRDLVREALSQGKPMSDIISSASGDFVLAVAPLKDGQDRVKGVLVLNRLIPEGLTEKLEAIAKGLREYQQLKILKGPIKVSHYVTLSLVTCLILFGAIWFGFKLAKSITVPLQELAEGTQRIAAGDYDFSRSNPETGDEIEHPDRTPSTG